MACGALKIKVLPLSALLALAVTAVFAQEEGGVTVQQYRQMLRQALKSGSYRQTRTENWDVRLKAVSGTVMLKTADGDEWVRIAGRIPLEPNDVVKTAGDGVAELYLQNKGAISPGRNTELEISSLGRGDTVFSLRAGSLAGKVASLPEGDKMRVRTPYAVCAVGGAEFAVEYSPLGRETFAAAFDEGRVVAVQPDETGKDPQEYTLEKNSEISLSPSRRRSRPAPLSRMARYRGTLGAMRSRLALLKAWRPGSAEKRDESRARALKRSSAGSRGKGAKVTPKVRAKAAEAAKRAKARRQARIEEEEAVEEDMAEGR